MRRLGFCALLMFLSATAYGTQASATADNFNASAYFTSDVADGVAVDRIDTASIDQDRVVLYVDWENMRIRAYRTEVRIIDPNGEVVGRVRNTIAPKNGRYYTYYYYRPQPGDTPGDWTYQVLVDGRNAFEARIPILAAE